ncbi:hypothetical protein [Metabacillus bambusae]|uniref:Uncharacterized protein n=1 Tax=Metabacillus bambusae TaxID=2795218 RepID=A0ABS3MZ32_9BACI|nr:hypothetical protein [Metabacillus bambusae]MBO1511129.1 hypothetical protein [Metabacillus bambusae]
MKRSAEELIEEISDFLVIYLKSGKVELNSFIKKTDLQISQLEQLLQIHFLLKEEVILFVKELPMLIRRFKTSTTVRQDTYHGYIKGQINWPKTINSRLTRNAKDSTIFSVNEKNREYAVKENLVLLEVIQTLYMILFKNIDSDYYKKYTWFQEWNELKHTVHHMLTKNIYLSRVQTEQKKVTDRMILDTLKHRNPLYRKAASILQQYRKVLAGEIDQKEVQQLLRETFVFPQEEDVLFELYWVVQLIEHNTNNAQLQIMDGRNNLVANWNDEKYIYKVFHDSTGSNQIKFNVFTNEVSLHEHPFINRKLNSMSKAEKLAKDLFSQCIDTSIYWSGRPDIIVEIYEKDTNVLKNVVIGEVKHTTRLEYAVTGLRELVDYVTFIKDRNSNYMDQNDEIKVRGMLFTDRVNMNQPNNKRLNLIEYTDQVVHISL